MKTATGEGLALCRTCGTLTDEPSEPCVVCGARVAAVGRSDLQAVWAFWVAGVLAYIPGNLWPIMVTEGIAGTTESTIVGGVVALIHYGSYAIAAVIFIASIAVPVTKFAIIAWLALSIQRSWPASPHTRHRAHQAVEFIGRWSMVDVFVVAALAALIQVGGLMSINPGIGINAFALSVVFTMLSAMSLDPRLIWQDCRE